MIIFREIVLALKNLSIAAMAWSTAIAHASCPSWPTAERFSLNDAQVVDHRTGLVWARCSVGQTWSGNDCTGNARTMTHEEALSHAQTQVGWRLPSAKELATLVDSGCDSPTIDAVAFPSTPSARWPSAYWTSTPFAGRSTTAWSVYFSTGEVYANFRTNNTLYARLIRTYP